MTLTYMGARPGYAIGSMDAGSAVVTFADEDHGFRVGNPVIGEVGGEAGAGARGTVGVGGTWPAESFPDEATLVASGEPDDPDDGGDPVSYAKDTGNVFRWTGSAWAQPSATFYSARVVLPLALRAVVVAVDGAQVTLDRPAVVATTNTKFWFDNYNVLLQALSSDQSEVRIPESAEKYACGSRLIVSNGPVPVTLFGDGKLLGHIYQPKGCEALKVELFADDVYVHDLTLERTSTDGAIWNGYVSYQALWEPTLSAQTAARPRFENVRSINGAWGDLQHLSCTDGEIRGCDVVYTEPPRFYAGWALQLTDGTGGGIYDCTFDADFLVGAIEVIKQTGAAIEGFVGRNALAASNASAHCDWDDIEITIEANSAVGTLAVNPGFVATAAIDWNRNQSNPSAEGGSLSNVRITQQGEIGGGLEFNALITRHAALSSSGDPITMGPGIELTTGGFSRAINAEASNPTQDLNIDGLTTDGVVRLHYGSVANTAAAELQYCPDNVTLGSGNDIDTLTVSGC